MALTPQQLIILKAFVGPANRFATLPANLPANKPVIDRGRVPLVSIQTALKRTAEAEPIVQPVPDQNDTILLWRNGLKKALRERNPEEDSPEFLAELEQQLNNSQARSMPLYWVAKAMLMECFYYRHSSVKNVPHYNWFNQLYQPIIDSYEEAIKANNATILYFYLEFLIGLLICLPEDKDMLLQDEKFNFVVSRGLLLSAELSGHNSHLSQMMDSLLQDFAIWYNAKQNSVPAMPITEAAATGAGERRSVFPYHDVEDFDFSWKGTFVLHRYNDVKVSALTDMLIEIDKLPYLAHAKSTFNEGSQHRNIFERYEPLLASPEQRAKACLMIGLVWGKSTCDENLEYINFLQQLLWLRRAYVTALDSEIGRYVADLAIAHMDTICTCLWFDSKNKPTDRLNIISPVTRTSYGEHVLPRPTKYQHGFVLLAHYLVWTALLAKRSVPCSPGATLETDFSRVMINMHQGEESVLGLLRKFCEKSVLRKNASRTILTTCLLRDFCAGEMYLLGHGSAWLQCVASIVDTKKTGPNSIASIPDYVKHPVHAYYDYLVHNRIQDDQSLQNRLFGKSSIDMGFFDGASSPNREDLYKIFGVAAPTESDVV